MKTWRAAVRGRGRRCLTRSICTAACCSWRAGGLAGLSAAPCPWQAPPSIFRPAHARLGGAGSVRHRTVHRGRVAAGGVSAAGWNEAITCLKVASLVGAGPDLLAAPLMDAPLAGGFAPGGASCQPAAKCDHRNGNAGGQGLDHAGQPLDRPAARFAGVAPLVAPQARAGFGGGGAGSGSGRPRYASSISKPA